MASSGWKILVYKHLRNTVLSTITKKPKNYTKISLFHCFIIIYDVHCTHCIFYNLGIKI